MRRHLIPGLRRVTIRKERWSRHADAKVGADTSAFYAQLTSLLKLYQFRGRKRRLICGLNATECYALAEVREYGPLAVQAVSDALSLDKSTGTRVVRSLERLGLVKRSASATDYKAHAIVVTQKGARLQNRLARQVWLEYAGVLAKFSPSQRKAATRIVRLVRTAAEGRLRRGVSFGLEGL
jgi:DNA-binding MarR family transcriptional regulator